MPTKEIAKMCPCHKVIRYLFIASLIYVLGACGTAPLTQVRQFGAATTTLSGSAKEAFTYLDSVEVQRKIYAVAADTSTGPTDETFTGFFDSPAGAVRANNDPRKGALELRLKVLDSLASYASALQALAAADYASDIDSASGQLNSALVSLGTDYKAATQKDIGLSDRDLGLIATAVNAIGKAVAARKQQEAIREITSAADPAVQAAAALIARDLAPESGAGLAEYAETSVALTRLALQDAYNRERKSPGSTFNSRIALLDSIQKVYQSKQSTATLFSNISKGADAMAQSHAALARAMQTKEMTSQELIKDLANLQAYAKSVQDFRASLKSNN